MSSSSRVRQVAGGVLFGLLTFTRMLMGFMLIMSGWTWLHRSDPAGYLTDAISTLLDAGRTVGLYAPFLESIVLPNAGVFAGLVGWGEFLSGISLLLGAAGRLGAGVAAFQVINYGLMGGYISLFFHGIFAAVLAATVYWKSARRAGLDRWFHRMWPSLFIC